MTNIIELNITDIDTVVGGVKLSQTAALQQMNVASLSTATMVYVPNKTFNTGSLSAGSPDISALLARMEARR